MPDVPRFYERCLEIQRRLAYLEIDPMSPLLRTRGSVQATQFGWLAGLDQLDGDYPAYARKDLANVVTFQVVGCGNAPIDGASVVISVADGSTVGLVADGEGRITYYWTDSARSMGQVVISADNYETKTISSGIASGSTIRLDANYTSHGCLNCASLSAFSGVRVLVSTTGDTYEMSLVGKPAITPPNGFPARMRDVWHATSPVGEYWAQFYDSSLTVGSDSTFSPGVATRTMIDLYTGGIFVFAIPTTGSCPAISGSVTLGSTTLTVSTY